MVFPIYLHIKLAVQYTEMADVTLSGERILSSLSIGALVVSGLSGPSLWHGILDIGPTDGRVTVEGGVHRMERGVSILATGRFLSGS